MTYSDLELDTVVTARQIREVGGCVGGQIEWFGRFDMCWRTIVREGVRLRDIHAKNDGDGNQVVERIVTKMREGSHG